MLLALARGAGPRGLSGMPRPAGPGRGAAAAAAARRDPGGDPQGVRRAGPGARGRTRTTPIRRTPGPGSAPTCCRPWSPRSARGRGQPGPYGRACWPPTPPSWTSWPPRRSPLPGRRPGCRSPRWPRLPAAVRTRVLHAWARELGAPGAALSHRHVAALDALVIDWHGQGAGPAARRDRGVPHVGSPEPGGWPVRVLTELPSRSGLPGRISALNEALTGPFRPGTAARGAPCAAAKPPCGRLGPWLTAPGTTPTSTT